MVVEPVGNIFKVDPQSGLEWGVAIAIGLGSLAVSAITKIISKQFFKDTPEQARERARRLAEKPVVYREHFWQIMRQPKPKTVIEFENSLSVSQAASNTTRNNQ
jgi:hypothetical protein